MHADEFAEKTAAGGREIMHAQCRVTDVLQHCFGEIWPAPREGVGRQWRADGGRVVWWYRRG